MELQEGVVHLVFAVQLELFFGQRFKRFAKRREVRDSARRGDVALAANCFDFEDFLVGFKAGRQARVAEGDE